MYSARAKHHPILHNLKPVRLAAGGRTSPAATWEASCVHPGPGEQATKISRNHGSYHYYPMINNA